MTARHTSVGLLGGAALTAGIVVADFALGPNRSTVGLLAMVPFVAALFCGAGVTGLVGVASLLVGIALGAHDHQLWTGVLIAKLAGIGVAAALAMGGAALRLRMLRRFVAVKAVAENVQDTLLRPIPPSMGGLQFAVRYLSAADAARVGGDLYEVVTTSQGCRVLIGDARGNGLDAVWLAANVLWSFREVAPLEPSLPAVADRLNRAVRRLAGEEGFVTALLLEITEPDAASLLCCGHHPPLLAADGEVRSVHITDPGLPLGLGAPGAVLRFAFRAGDRLLLHTDGVCEARDRHGREFPLLDLAEQSLAALPEPAQGADRLFSLLRRHVGKRNCDDAALLLISRTSPDPHQRPGLQVPRTQPAARP